jgi:hypothetical protein
MSNAISWTEPPRPRAREDWQAIADTLRANPGKWAKIETASLHYGNVIKHGKTKAFQPAGSFEATLQQRVLYARFIGDNQ